MQNMLIRNLVLLVKFGDEAHVARGKIGINPLINAAAHLRTEVILPIAGLSFPYEVSFVIHETRVFGWFVIDKLVGAEIVET